MDLFEFSMEKKLDKIAPLAERMRPETLDEFVGQNHILDNDKFLYRAIKADTISSIILYGPPGTGKTTLAKIIANTTNKYFEQLSAVTSGVKDLREVIKKAEDRLSIESIRTILFIDEIHRFNKSQQDALLPFVENGVIILIGATTENPYFEVNKALISRSMVFELKPINKDDMKKVIDRALKDKNRGLGNYNVNIDESALEHLVNISNGDARVALNGLEVSVLTTPKDKNGTINITVDIIEECIQKKYMKYDKNGDEHYDTVSAFIKSMRGSDPDATLYWLGRMIYAGEDPKFIARRIIICASEDVGNADPNALNVAVSAFNALEIIGMPEGRIPLAQAAVYVACAPKSNSCYVGINKAIEDVKNKEALPVPLHLKDTSYYGSKKLGRGKGYKYPHNYPNSYVEQDYFPKDMGKVKYYTPTSNGYERIIKEYLDKLFDKE